MALPSGYRAIPYIYGYSAHYINTGFYPKNTTRVVMDYETNDLYHEGALFGAKSLTSSPNGYFGMLLNSDYVYAVYQTGITHNDIAVVPSSSGRHIYELNQNVASVDGVGITLPSATFTCNSYLCLLAIGYGTDSKVGDIHAPEGKLYSCQVYDNGTLVRDFIPALRLTDNEPGLYDDVNGVFYTSAYTTTNFKNPTPESNHKVMVNGNIYGILSGKTLLSGTNYNVVGGKTMVAGTIYDIGLKKQITVVGTDIGFYGAAEADSGFIFNGDSRVDGTYYYDSSSTISVYVYWISSVSYKESCRIYLNGTVVQTGSTSYTIPSPGQYNSIHIEFKNIDGNYYNCYITTT